LKELVAMNLQMENLEASLDSNLALHIKETGDIESAVEKLQEAITLSCNKSFKTIEITKKIKICFMVNRRTYYQKEETECPKMTLPENKK
jgi:hypothetical protein